jgi:hypothetical protein
MIHFRCWLFTTFRFQPADVSSPASAATPFSRQRRLTPHFAADAEPFAAMMPMMPPFDRLSPPLAVDYATSR